MFCKDTLTIYPSEREKVLVSLHQSHQGITQTKLLALGCVFWPGINKAIEKLFGSVKFKAQNAAAPLTPTPTPSCPWQICASDIFTLDGVDYIILTDFYSNVMLVCSLPPGQSKSAKVIHILEEWFCDHCTPEVIHTGDGPQYASAAFSELQY